MFRPLITWRDRLPRPVEEMQKEMEGLLSRYFGGQEGTSPQFAPALNVAETDGGFEVTVDLPGLDAKDVSVEMTDGVLVIAGQKQEEMEEKGKRFHRVERYHGSFHRSVTLPTPVDEDKIEAEYKDGVLRILLPKSERVRPRQIQVNAGNKK
jgi:HSP20 family protein